MVEYDKFFKSIIEYYGEHENKTVTTMTKQYVQKKFKINQLSEIKAAIFLSHPSSWGFPDIAVMEKAYQLYKKDKLQVEKIISYPEFNQDLSISDEEWKQGFKGMEALKKAVHSEEMKKTITPTRIDRAKLEEVKEELKS